MRSLIALAVALAVTPLAGCKSKSEKRCDHYVDLQIKCGEDKAMDEETKSALRLFAGGMCKAALDGDLASASNGEGKEMLREMEAKMQREVACLDKVTTCDAWQKCQAPD